jgi:ADP-ribose pyrophosphatase YjhB (NUDIX family)
MPVPDFIQALRAKVGHDLLWLSGVSAVVFDGDGRVLLTRRADSGGWALVSGILEPGEEPARAIVREIAEETGVEATVERLASVLSDPPFELPNGDALQFLTLTFRCRYVSGEARVADDENLEVRWFGLDELPELNERTRVHLQSGLVPDGPTQLRT